MGQYILKAAMKLAVKLAIGCILIVVAYANVPVPTFKPVIGRVAPNENIYRFALRMNIPLDDVKTLNGLLPPFVVYINQPLIAKVRITPKIEEHTILDRLERPLSHVVPTVEVPLPAEKPQPKRVYVPPYKPWRIKSRLTLELPEPAARVSSRFLWPLQGKLISKFKDKHNGILIAATAKEPVRTAENGVVAFVGEQLKGLGCVVLVKHAEGWISAYGKIGLVGVKRGDIVNRGDIVGYVADRKEPQLLFELRHETEPKNPLDHLMIYNK